MEQLGPLRLRSDMAAGGDNLCKPRFVGRCSLGPLSVSHCVDIIQHQGASQVALVVKNPPVNAGDIGDAGLIPGSERSPGGGNNSPLQYSYLEKPMDRGA